MSNKIQFVWRFLDDELTLADRRQKKPKIKNLMKEKTLIYLENTKYLPYVQPNFTTGIFQEAEKIK
jgi:hypothetical protein